MEQANVLDLDFSLDVNDHTFTKANTFEGRGVMVQCKKCGIGIFLGNTSMSLDEVKRVLSSAPSCYSQFIGLKETAKAKRGCCGDRRAE